MSTPDPTASRGPIDGPTTRTSTAGAMYWASRLIGLALEFGVFVALGWWLDRQFGTRPVLVLVGMVLGMAAAGWHLALIAREAGKIKPPRLKNPLPPPPEDDPGDEDWPSPRRSKRD